MRTEKKILKQNRQLVAKMYSDIVQTEAKTENREASRKQALF